MNAHPTSKPCPHGPTPSLSTALQIPQYVIAVPIRGDGRQLAVASPAYLERHGTPAHPRELATRRCVGWRTAPSVAPYRWEFEEAGKEFSVTVADTITTTDMALIVKLAVAGAGIGFGMEESFRDRKSTRLNSSH